MQAANPKMDPKRDLCAFYNKVRSYTEKLCEPLEIEDFIPQPIVDVSPPRWNIAHTTWFFEEMILKRLVPGYKIFDENFGFLFNSYYNSIGKRTARDHRGDLSRPTVKHVFEYRRYVDEKMNELLSEPSAAAGGLTKLNDNPTGSKLNIQPPVTVAEFGFNDLVILGLNHEQQHQELFLTDLKYTFGLNPLFPSYRDDFAVEEKLESGAESFAGLEGGTYEIGFEGDGFCFDNELSRHKVYLNDFEISNRLVTNLEYLEFIQDGGYRDHRLWHSEGWDWVNQNGVSAPLYWQHRDGVWFHFTLGGLRKLPLDAPVCHISLYEAAAFADWREMRLPTEFEWEAASDKFDWGLRWEWTNSAYLPYPGFKKAAGAVGEYNGKFMINQMVLRGSSVATPEGHSRKTYRNFFQPNLRWQFTGIRLAK
jgi:formylglycine-generating enzyme required for sulfatase activity